MKIRSSFGSRLFDTANTAFMMVLIAVTLYPLLYVLAISLSSAPYVQANMVTIIPRGFTLDSYERVFQNSLFWNAYGNTIVYTVVGTAINLIMTCALAFVLSRKEFLFKKSLTLLIVVTMFFSGGLIPMFILIKNLHLYNTMWAILLPSAINTWNMIIVKTYMQGLPEEIIESAKMDGANDLYVLARIVIPLSMPVIVTIGLFYAVGHWNEWFNPLIYFKEKAKMPLQVILRNMIVETDLSGMADAAKGVVREKPTSDMIISTSMIVAMIPILCAYPFVQKHFVKGILIGSLKG